MTTSLGYVLMNWTATFSKQKKKRKSSNVAVVGDKQVRCSPPESKCCQTSLEDFPCLACQEKSSQLDMVGNELEALHRSTEDLKKKLAASSLSLAATIEKESRLRNENENLILEEAQSRYDLDQLKKQLKQTLDERDQVHAERVRLYEKALEDKECEWAKKNEALRHDLRQALRSSIEDTQREAESLENLDQEIQSLQMVIEMRSTENRELRIHNNELLTQVDRLAYLEAELANARHRLDEMTLVLQNKMDSERELLDLSETLQKELVKSRAEALQARKNLENHQYLQEEIRHERPPLKVQHSHSEIIVPPSSLPHRNHHQQASSGSKAAEGSKNNGLVMNVREKTESVAWMIQMPTNASPSHGRRKIK